MNSRLNRLKRPPRASSNTLEMKYMLKKNLQEKVTDYIYARRIALILSTNNDFYKESRPTQDLIKIWTRTVRILILLHRHYIDTKRAFSTELNQLKSFAQYGNYELTMVSSETVNIKAEMMHFYASSFSKEPELSRINRDCLKMERVPRTLAELVSLKNDLRRLPKQQFLCRLAPELLEKLFKCCWLEEFESDRIIVKQYQIPRRFYIIMKGSLVCTYRADTNKESTTVCFLEQGMTFGDLPITSESMHTTTLITRSRVQLLVLEARDFFEIFVGSKTEENSLEANIGFLKRVLLFRGWPVELLAANPNALKSCSYKRNQVITKDSGASKYIYIVKSGYLSVWTKLRLGDSKRYKKSIAGLVEEYLEADDSILPKNKHQADVLHIRANTFHGNSFLRLEPSQWAITPSRGLRDN